MPPFWRRSVEPLDAAAQCELGSRYLLGRGVKPDAVEAMKWFLISAERGFEPAVFVITPFQELRRALGAPAWWSHCDYLRRDYTLGHRIGR